MSDLPDLELHGVGSSGGPPAVVDSLIENVTACLVTRGDHDLDPVIYSLADAGIPLIKIWDNSKRDHDLSVYGRYALIEETDSPLIYVQDDDCVLPPESIQEIIWQSDSGSSAYGQLVCNMPPQFRHGFYDEHALVGFGACFHRDLPEKAWWRLRNGFDETAPWVDFDMDFFHRTCDVAFTALTPYSVVDVPYENLPWAEDADRMYRQPGHAAERSKMLELAFRVKDVT